MQLEGAAWQIVGAADDSISFCSAAASLAFQLGRTELQNSGSGQGGPCVGSFGARWGSSFVAGRVLSHYPNHNLGGCFVTKPGKDVG